MRVFLALIFDKVLDCVKFDTELRNVFSVKNANWDEKQTAMPSF